MPFPVEDKYIEEAEGKLGLRFPISFRNKMKGQNGGEVETDDDNWGLYPFFDRSDTTRIKRTSNDIVRETGLARQWDDFPENGVAIADNGSGDRLILLPDPNDPSCLAGAIYLWNHETGEVSKIANDLSQLQ